jgi:MFS family permease
MVLRGLVGIGEASYSCVAPTIIGDLFTDEMRTRMLTVFYLATPLGSGLGYIISSNVAKAVGWRYAFYVTPPLGLVCIVLLIILVDEPKRGSAEGTVASLIPNSVMSDVVYLLKK